MRAKELPTGTVTLLFTDIAGSTKLLHELGDSYADVLAEHRRVLREAFTRHGGVEVDTQGDAFFFAFARASDAVTAAAAGQRALATLQQSVAKSETAVRVRMGIHTGEPTRTEEGYVGLDVHRAARIMSAGHGGQVVVSQTTRELIAPDSLRDLGLHRLKDVGELRLYQLGERQFPPLKTLNQTNLPLPATPLVGRKKELADVLQLFREARLLTLTGPGGIGKTRFALEVAGELVERFRDGVFFSDLSAVREPALVLPTIASVLGAKGELAQHIADKELLLVLDNLEQVVDVAPELARLLERCPNLQLLATSREPLRVRGEREYPLRPLLEAPAVELFRQRAQAARPDFEADYGALVEICERLDRLPLAIELAAARTRLLSAEALRERLEQRLPLLAGGDRDLPARQRTLRATIEWSYELLSPEEQELFRRLAVFAGGWTLEAAEAVCDAELDTLESLVEKSLVGREDKRYTMLETVREYARKLLEGSDEADELSSCHAQHYVRLGEDAERELTGAAQAEWLRRLDAELGNVREALRWARGGERDALGLRLATALHRFWTVRGHLEEARTWLEAVFSPDQPASLRTKAHASLAWLAAMQGDLEQARAHAEARLRLCREAGDRFGECQSLHLLAGLAVDEGDLERAADLQAESVGVARELGDPRQLAVTLLGSGLLERRLGNHDAAARLVDEGVVLARRIGDEGTVAYGVTLGGGIALDRGDAEAALALIAEGMARFHGLGDEAGVARCLDAMAAVLADRGDAELAARLLGAGEAVRERIEVSMGLDDREFYERVLATVGTDDPALAAATRAGRELSLDEAVAVALRALD